MNISNYLAERRMFFVSLSICGGIIFIIAILIPDIVWPNMGFLKQFGISILIMIAGLIILAILSNTIEYLINSIRKVRGIKTSKEMSVEIEEAVNKENEQKRLPEKAIQRIEGNTITILILLILIIVYLFVEKLDMTSIRENIREFVVKTFGL